MSNAYSTSLNILGSSTIPTPYQLPEFSQNNLTKSAFFSWVNRVKIPAVLPSQTCHEDKSWLGQRKDKTWQNVRTLVPLFSQGKFSLKSHCPGVTGCRKGKRIRVVHLTSPCQAFSVFPKASNGFCKLCKSGYILSCYKIQSRIHFVVLGESLTKGSEFYEFSRSHIHNRDILFSFSFKFKGKMLPKAENTYQIFIFHVAFLLLWLNVETMKLKSPLIICILNNCDKGLSHSSWLKWCRSLEMRKSFRSKEMRKIRCVWF